MGLMRRMLARRAAPASGTASLAINEVQGVRQAGGFVQVRSRPTRPTASAKFIQTCQFEEAQSSMNQKPGAQRLGWRVVESRLVCEDARSKVWNDRVFLPRRPCALALCWCEERLRVRGFL